MDKLEWLLGEVRILKPLQTIQEHWIGASIAGTLGTFGSFFAKIFQTEPALIWTLALAIIVDLITGIISSKRRKNPIGSLGARQTCVKVLEYGLVLGLLINVANTYGQYDNVFGTMVGYVDVAAFGFLTWIEILSIKENLSKKNTKLRKMIEDLQNKYEKDN